MTLTFDPEIYNGLLTQVSPKVIESEQEYERLLALTEKLYFSRNRTAEEDVLYKLLVTLVELYETEHYPMPESTPHEILLHIMESSGTTEADLVGVIGSSEVVSEVVSGKRALSPWQAETLADRFKVAPSLFL